MKIKQILIGSTLVSSVLMSNMIVNKVSMKNYPMNESYRSISTGGELSEIEAYSDGIGLILEGDDNPSSVIDNSAMNELVYKYGKDAEKNNVPIFDYIDTLSNLSDEDKERNQQIKDNFIEINPFIEVASIEEAYLNPKALSKKRAKIGSVELLYDGKYWRNSQDQIQRYLAYSDSIEIRKTPMFSTHRIKPITPYEAGSSLAIQYPYGRCNTKPYSPNTYSYQISCGGSYSDGICPTGYSKRIDLVDMGIWNQYMESCVSKEKVYHCAFTSPLKYNLDTETNECVQTSPGCETGYSYNSSTDQCSANIPL